MIALIDYGAGNLTSVRKALSAVGAEFVTPTRVSELSQVHGIIVPGVGHFDATRALDDEWRGAIRSALDRQVSLFGICLGMQWLFEGSTEAPGVPGLGVFAGICHRLREQSTQQSAIDPTPLSNATATSEQGTQNSEIDPTPFLKVPHVGWNTLVPTRSGGIMADVERDAQVYFTHSYVAPVTAVAAATTAYGGTTFASAVERGRIAGVQFHPEKSGNVGLRILCNWLALSERRESTRAV